MRVWHHSHAVQAVLDSASPAGPSPVDSKFPQAQLEAEKAESSEGRPKDGETGEGKEGNNGKEGNKSNGSDPSTDEVVIPEWTQQGRMLHEFEKLGKVRSHRSSVVHA